MLNFTAVLLGIFVSLHAFAGDSTIVHLWPGDVPGEKDTKHPAIVTDNHQGNVIRLTDVTDPTLTIFTPEKSKANGAAVLVCPGGGYKILAINLEGYAIAHWLTQQGITAFVLQYRVPDKQAGALQDAQRAMRIIRAHAAKWDIHPDQIGIMGFSAGGSLSARLSTEYEKQLYKPVDPADRLSARPDFTLLIYPAYLNKGPNHTLTPELKVDKEKTPPMFIFQTADDPYGQSSLVMAEALRENKIPVELHLYPKGGHGYGLRNNNPAGATWPGLAEKWLKETLTYPAKN